MATKSNVSSASSSELMVKAVGEFRKKQTAKKGKLSKAPSNNGIDKATYKRLFVTLRDSPFRVGKLAS